MPYIFESYKPELEQQFEIFGFSGGEIDLDAITEEGRSSVRLTRAETIELINSLQSWLDATWGQ